MTPIFILASALGTIVPLLLLLLLYKGIEESPVNESKKKKYKIGIAAATISWTLLGWGLGAAGLFGYHSGDALPRFLFPLLFPVVLGVVLLRDSYFKTILDHIPLSLIVGMQTFRLLGILFLLVVDANLAPESFASGGYGDIATGVLALLAAIMLKNNWRGSRAMAWLFTVVGCADLLNVAFLLLYYYPIWSNAQPSSSGAADFPLVLVLEFAAPFALTFHFYTIRSLFLTRSVVKSTN